MGEDNSEIMTIKLDELIRIFQINDLAIYAVADKELSASQWDLALSGWKKLSPQDISFFNKFESPEDVHGMYANGENISILVSRCRINNQNVVSLSIFFEMPSDKKDSDDSQLKLIPAFSLVGELGEGGNINVIEAHARLPDTDDSILTLGAENLQDVMGFIVYANDCFISMLKDRIISLEDLANTLSEAHLANAKQVYERLCTRTKFDTNLLRKNKNPDDAPYTLPLSSLDNIFLLESTEIYFEPEDENIPVITDQIRHALAQVKSDYASLFEDKRNFKCNEIRFLQGENGDSFLSVAFDAENFFGIFQDYHILLLFKSFTCSLPDKQDEMVVNPISIILGQVNQLKNTFEPLAVYCVVPSDTEDSLRVIALTTTAEFCGAVCHAEQGMKDVFSGNELDIVNLSHWIKTSEYGEILKRYELILHRLESGFLRDTEDDKLSISCRKPDEEVLLSNPSLNAFFISGPPTPQ